MAKDKNNSKNNKNLKGKNNKEEVKKDSILSSWAKR